MDNLVSLEMYSGLEQDDDVEFGVAGRGEKRKRFKFASAVRDVMNDRLLKEMVQRMEPFFRALVREEVERASRRLRHASPGPSSNRIESSGVRNWQLHFVNKLPSTIFTASRLEAEDGTPLKIVILDARSKEIITSGPLSSLKIEILVLDGDFGTDENEDWTENQFNSNIVREREGKRPLVTGDLFVTLRSGVCCIDDVSFTDNSSWIRSRKFRLGVRTVPGISNELQIREGRSKAFVVKDHRGELYKKHHPPSLDDEVWRLERIAKGGASHKRLDSNRICNVRDFLRLSVIDPSLLRKILGNGITSKIWEIIMEHANTCVEDEQLYVYYKAGERAGLVLSSTYKIVGLTFDGHSYQPMDKLNMPQKVLMEGLKHHAYKNVNDIVPFSTRPLPTIQNETFNNNPCLPQLNFPVTHQDQSDSQMGFDQSSYSSYSYDWHDNNQVVVSLAQCHHPLEASGPMLRASFKMKNAHTDPFSGGIGRSSTGLLGGIMPNGHLAADNTFQFQTSTLFPVSATWGEGNSLLFAANNDAEVRILSSHPNFGIGMSRKGKPRASWCKVRAALKWGISVRRDVAAKKMEKPWRDVAAKKMENPFFYSPQIWDYLVEE